MDAMAKLLPPGSDSRPRAELQALRKIPGAIEALAPVPADARMRKIAPMITRLRSEGNDVSEAIGRGGQSDRPKKRLPRLG